MERAKGGSEQLGERIKEAGEFLGSARGAATANWRAEYLTEALGAMIEAIKLLHLRVERLEEGE